METCFTVPQNNIKLTKINTQAKFQIITYTSNHSKIRTKQCALLQALLGVFFSLFAFLLQILDCQLTTYCHTVKDVWLILKASFFHTY